eukprot:scaffold24412_cov63-Phaeocystis_antarctica.AAC.2
MSSRRPHASRGKAAHNSRERRRPGLGWAGSLTLGRIDGQYLHPDTQLDDPPSAVVAGGRRQPKPGFEWQRDAICDPDEISPPPVRVACKSAQLLWDLTSKCGRPKLSSPRGPYWKAGAGRLPLTLTQILEGAVH